MRLLPALMLIFAFALPARAEAPRLAADIAPVQSLAARVMAGVGEPGLILPQDASPHVHAMRPSEARAVQEADLIVWVGPGLTPWMEEALDTLAPDTPRLMLRAVPGTTILPFREGAAFGAHDHDHDHGHDHAGHDHAGHDQGDDHGQEDGHDGDGHAAAEGDMGDPHLWLDPQNAMLWLDAIAEALAALDPENADVYRANALAARAELETLSAEIAARLATASDPVFLVSHDALHYFEARFGVYAAGAVSDGDAASPGAARLSALRAHAEDQGATCLLVEPGENAARLSTVFGSDLRIVEADVTGRTLPPGSGLYPALLDGLARAIASCAGS